MVGAGALVCAVAQPDRRLAAQFARAAGVLLAGMFLALTVWRASARFSRALTATVLAGAALVIWMWHLGLGWRAKFSAP